MPRNSGLHSQNLTDTPPKVIFKDRSQVAWQYIWQHTYASQPSIWEALWQEDQSLRKVSLGYNGRPVSNRKQSKAKRRERLLAEPTKAEHAQCLKTFAKGHCRAVQLEGSEVRAAIKRFQKSHSKNQNNYNISTTRQVFKIRGKTQPAFKQMIKPNAYLLQARV